MVENKFQALYDQYENIFAQMGNVFTAHEFILKLANQNQKAYVEALYSYRNNTYQGTPAPFMMLHRALARHLRTHSELIQWIRDDAPSKNIFGDDGTCSEWRKV
jgi:hypothetical protein